MKYNVWPFPGSQSEVGFGGLHMLPMEGTVSIFEELKIPHAMCQGQKNKKYIYVYITMYEGASIVPSVW